jgi:uracil-DNA glycosylase
MLLVGGYAHRWHIGAEATQGVTAAVTRWREILEEGSRRPRCLPLPHPSWRNNAWIKKNPWFETELVPRLRAEVRALLDGRRT